MIQLFNTMQMELPQQQTHPKCVFIKEWSCRTRLDGTTMTLQENNIQSKSPGAKDLQRYNASSNWKNCAHASPF
jgi:hypothetical protein